MGWLVPRDELTPDQIRAIELDTREHRVILGGPGSGKTQILLHRARHLADEFRVKPDRFRIFVFNNVLKAYIRRGLQDLDLPEQCVTTLDDFCAQIYKKEVRASLPWDTENHCPDYASVRKSVSKCVAGRKQFDFVLVDEGQDLDSQAFTLLKELAPHVTVAMDHKQQIYDDGSGENEILTTLGLRKRNLTLLDAFRCCPYIIQVAAEFIEANADREIFLRQGRAAQTEIQTPLLYQATDFDDEKARLIDVLRERLIVDRSIAILFPQNRQVEGFAAGLRAAGIPVETRKSGLDFTSSAPKVLTIHSAKGLTFDSVLMPRLVGASFAGKMEQRTMKLLYVGATRATKWLYLSTISGRSAPALKRVRALAELRPAPLTVGSRATLGSNRPQGRPEASTGNNEDLLDIL